ncbi:hypothetical protein H4219_005716 [Mycoemilia scoparia]|uniref:Uncharacterized protein n=1 Tax=Mycoemilia scoparia TaxID=417184 RepID=A0A9W7ZS49_9FUNG|nr:hypothetical protein H4219_005716 [Mycoemilia scoparia]
MESFIRSIKELPGRLSVRLRSRQRTYPTTPTTGTPQSQALPPPPRSSSLNGPLGVGEVPNALPSIVLMGGNSLQGMVVSEVTVTYQVFHHPDTRLDPRAIQATLAGRNTGGQSTGYILALVDTSTGLQGITTDQQITVALTPTNANINSVVGTAQEVGGSSSDGIHHSPSSGSDLEHAISQAPLSSTPVPSQLSMSPGSFLPEFGESAISGHSVQDQQAATTPASAAIRALLSSTPMQSQVSVSLSNMPDFDTSAIAENACTEQDVPLGIAISSGDGDSSGDPFADGYQARNNTEVTPIVVPSIIPDDGDQRMQDPFRDPALRVEGYSAMPSSGIVSHHQLPQQSSDIHGIALNSSHHSQHQQTPAAGSANRNSAPDQHQQEQHSGDFYPPSSELMPSQNAIPVSLLELVEQNQLGSNHEIGNVLDDVLDCYQQQH